LISGGNAPKSNTQQPLNQQTPHPPAGSAPHTNRLSPRVGQGSVTP
jgi:hypothetical protein